MKGGYLKSRKKYCTNKKMFLLRGEKRGLIQLPLTEKKRTLKQNHRMSPRRGRDDVNNLLHRSWMLREGLIRPVVTKAYGFCHEAVSLLSNPCRGPAPSVGVCAFVKSDAGKIKRSCLKSLLSVNLLWVFIGQK